MLSKLRSSQDVQQTSISNKQAIFRVRLRVEIHEAVDITYLGNPIP